MPIATVIELLLKFGIPLTQQALALHEAKAEVTSADFAELIKLSQYSSADSLRAAGLKIVDGNAVPV